MKAQGLIEVEMSLSSLSTLSTSIASPIQPSPTRAHDSSGTDADTDDWADDLEGDLEENTDTMLSQLTQEQGDRAAHSDFLARVPFLRPLSVQDLTKVARMVESVTFADADAIVNESETADCMHIIQDGGAKAVKGGETLCEYADTDFFGELALLNSGDRRSASVFAVGKTKCLKLGRAAFDMFLVDGACGDMSKARCHEYITRSAAVPLIDDDARYECVAPAAVTIDLEVQYNSADGLLQSSSTNGKIIQRGDFLQAIQQGETSHGVRRVRTTWGWVSIYARDGEQLLQSVASTVPASLLVPTPPAVPPVPTSAVSKATPRRKVTQSTITATAQRAMTAVTTARARAKVARTEAAAREAMRRAAAAAAKVKAEVAKEHVAAAAVAAAKAKAVAESAKERSAATAASATAVAVAPEEEWVLVENRPDESVVELPVVNGCEVGVTLAVDHLNRVIVIALFGAGASSGAIAVGAEVLAVGAHRLDGDANPKGPKLSAAIAAACAPTSAELVNYYSPPANEPALADSYCVPTTLAWTIRTQPTPAGVTFAEVTAAQSKALAEKAMASNPRLRGPAGQLIGQLFDAIDADSSGMLEENEGRAFLQLAGCGAGDLDHYWQDVLNVADTDGDGHVSKHEFLLYMLNDVELDDAGDFVDASHAGMYRQQLRYFGPAGNLCGQLFDVIDDDDSGCLDEEEAKVFLRCNGCEESEVDYYYANLLRASDTDGDGRVSKLEFLAYTLGDEELDASGDFSDQGHRADLQEQVRLLLAQRAPSDGDAARLKLEGSLNAAGGLSFDELQAMKAARQNKAAQLRATAQELRIEGMPGYSTARGCTLRLAHSRVVWLRSQRGSCGRHCSCSKFGPNGEPARSTASNLVSPFASCPARLIPA
jgi:Ca2+-binding EF-hand superfamily protein/CRP-like cAMP-binding protein